MHPNIDALGSWCSSRQLLPYLPRERRLAVAEGLKLHRLLNYFDEAGQTRELIRDFGLGGEKRIARLTAAHGDQEGRQREAQQ